MIKTLVGKRVISAEVLARFRTELSRARLVLIARYPFWGSLLAHLRIVPTYSVATAAVSADDRLFINPEFFHEIGTYAAHNGRENAMRAFVLAHECAHPALGIFWRSIGHDPRLSNIAHDHIINLMLELEDPDWIWAECYHDHRFSGMTYEQVYHALAEEQSKDSGSADPGDEMGGGFGSDVKPAGFLDDEVDGEQEGVGAGSKPAPISNSDLEAHARRWEQRVIESYLNAKAQGRIGKGAERIFGNVGKARVRWESKLRNKVSDAFTHSKLDWGSPHRRYTSTGVYAPREQYLGLNAAVYMDTSGSISPQSILRGMSEVDKIVRVAGGRVRLLEGDALISSDRWIRKLPKRVHGGGGTSFVPLFNHLRNDRSVKALIIFTDTWGEMPDFKPRFPVIWAVYESAMKHGIHIPFGEVVVIPEEQN